MSQLQTVGGKPRTVALVGAGDDGDIFLEEKTGRNGNTLARLVRVRGKQRRHISQWFVVQDIGPGQLLEGLQECQKWARVQAGVEKPEADHRLSLHEELRAESTKVEEPEPEVEPEEDVWEEVLRELRIAKQIVERW